MIRFLNLLIVFTVSVTISCDVPLEQFYKGKLDKRGKYDLAALSLAHIPKHIKVGDKVIFNTTVKNVGYDDVPHGTYDVDLYLDSSLISFDHGTSVILAGGEIAYSMSLGYHHCGYLVRQDLLW